jgi:hypothetical protein
MTTAKTTPPDELRMSSKEFDRIMGRALQVKPEEAKKPRRETKAKPKATNKKVLKK